MGLDELLLRHLRNGIESLNAQLKSHERRAEELEQTLMQIEEGLRGRINPQDLHKLIVITPPELYALLAQVSSNGGLTYDMLHKYRLTDRSLRIYSALSNPSGTLGELDYAERILRQRKKPGIAQALSVVLEEPFTADYARVLKQLLEPFRCEIYDLETAMQVLRITGTSGNLEDIVKEGIFGFLFKRVTLTDTETEAAISMLQELGNYEQSKLEVKTRAKNILGSDEIWRYNNTVQAIEALGLDPNNTEHFPETKNARDTLFNKLETGYPPNVVDNWHQRLRYPEDAERLIGMVDSMTQRDNPQQAAQAARIINALRGWIEFDPLYYYFAEIAERYNPEPRRHRSKLKTLASIPGLVMYHFIETIREYRIEKIRQKLREVY